MLWMLRRIAATSTGRWGRRSTLVISTTSALRNIRGYLSGLSSPSVTLSNATLWCSPTSNSAGQTRLPTFSTSSKSSAEGSSRCCSNFRPPLTMAASRWQALPVVMGTTGMPTVSKRSASSWVVMSPSSTAMLSSRAKAGRDRSSRAVFPAPGLLIRLRQSRSQLWKCSLLCSA